MTDDLSNDERSAKERRLSHLRKQKAYMGINTPADVVMQIEDLTKELEDAGRARHSDKEHSEASRDPHRQSAQTESRRIMLETSAEVVGIPSDHPPDELIGTRLEFLDERLLERYLTGGTLFLEKYYGFLKHFQNPDQLQDSLDDLLEVIEKLPQGKSQLASVTGFSATGKSCLLNMIYLRQLERFNHNKSRFAPVFLNLHTYLKEDYDENSIASSEISSFIDEANKLCTDASTTADGLLLIVDGCDEYFRHPSQRLIDEQFEAFVQDISARKRVIRVVGVGKSDTTYPADHHSQVLSWAERDELVRLRRIKTDEPTVDKILADYVALNSSDVKKLTAEAMKARITGHRIEEIDLFVLSLIEESIKKDWSGNFDGLESLYATYCRQHVRKQNRDEAAAAVKRLAADVFNFYVRRPYRETAPGPQPKKQPVEHVVRLDGIPHLHASLKEYLIASHIIDLITNSTPDEARRERFIYPYGINRFVRSIINRDASMQERVFAAISRDYKNSPIRERIHLAYLLGRFKSPDVCDKSKALLNDYLIEHEKETNNNADYRKLKPDSVTFKQRLLLQRTLSISAIYLEDRKRAKTYLASLLRSAHSDDLNRGFHLEYYEDAPRNPDPEVMIASDDATIRPVKTFEVLIKKLRDDLSKGKTRAMTCVELHTLCSLCVHRHLLGNLAEQKRSRLIEFLAQFKNITQREFRGEFGYYIEAVSYILQRENASIGSLFVELHSLKKQKRAGWNASRLDVDPPVHRKCPYPESVSDHVWGCLLIAEAFLPEKSSEPCYSKREILRMLTIHDLAETFTGDKPHFEKTQVDDRKEDQLMRRTSAYGAFSRLPGIARWNDCWDRLERRKDINAQVVNDIDKIESYIQLMQYIRDPNCRVPDAENWAADVEKDLVTDLGRGIFQSLRHEQTGLLQWFRDEKLGSSSE